MKTGDLMVELRKLPGGKPFAVEVDGVTHTDGTLKVSEEGVKLTFGVPKKAPVKRRAKK